MGSWAETLMVIRECSVVVLDEEELSVDLIRLSTMIGAAKIFGRRENFGEVEKNRG